MDYKLELGEPQAFHRLVYEKCKGAIERHDVLRERERERLGDQSCKPEQ